MLNNKGQTLVEYVLIIAIISTFIIGMFFFLKNEFMDQITRLSCELSGQEYHDGDKRGKGYYEENLGLMKKRLFYFILLLFIFLYLYCRIFPKRL